MNKFLLLSSAVLLMASGANAQLSKTGAADDFTSATEYTSTGGGVYWWASDDYVLTRDVANSKLAIAATAVDQLFTSFGVGWGDEDGSADGNDFFTIDLTGDASFSVDVTNHHTDSTLVLKVGLKDNANQTGEILYKDAGTVTWGNMYQQARWSVAPGATESVVFDFDQVLIATAWTCAAADECPSVSTEFKQDSVTGIVFNINPAAGEAFESYGAFTGLVDFSNFQIGVMGEIISVPELNQLAAQVYPNPATNLVNIVSNTASAQTVIVRDLLGAVVYAETFAGKTQIDIAGLESGVYLVEVATDVDSSVTKLIKK